MTMDPAKPGSERTLVALTIRGTKHQGPEAQAAVQHAMRTDEGLFTLEADPGNKVDPDAVKILLDGRHVGYVPAEKAREVGQWLKEGRILWIRSKPEWSIIMAVRAGDAW